VTVYVAEPKDYTKIVQFLGKVYRFFIDIKGYVS